MTDIVERLRERSQQLWTSNRELNSNKLVKEAADEITRLRAALSEIKEHCLNPGKWDEVVMTRIIERVEETARAALEGSNEL